MDISTEAIQKFAQGADDVTEAPMTDQVIAEEDSIPDVAPVQDDEPDDDDIDIIGIDMSATSAVPAKSAVDNYTEIIRENLGNLSKSNPDHYDNVSKKLVDEIRVYRRDLIINHGMTPDEADEAAKNRAIRSAKEEYQSYYQEHPEVAVIEVSKDDAGKINLTPEQKKKLEVTKKIQIVEVEERKLNQLNVKEVDREEKAIILHRNTCSLSHYELPFYNTKDYFTFNGANILKLTNATYGDDGALAFLLKKAQLLYDCFLESTTRSKYDAEGNTIMSYNDFVNWFRFDDVDTGIYCIYVASSTEMITSSFSCRSKQCLDTLPPEARRNGRQFNATYNSKSIIKFDDAEDDNKAVINDILENKDSMSKMIEFQNRPENSMAWRVQSTFTNNIYEFTVPTISDAIVAYENQQIDPDGDEGSLLNYVMWTRAIYLYDGDNEDGEATYIKLDTIEEIVGFYKNIIETERALISMSLSKKLYKPSYSIKTKCPNCGNEHELEISIPELVFLRSRSIEAGII